MALPAALKFNYVVYPLAVVMLGLLSSMVAVLSMAVFKSMNPQAALRYATFLGAIL